MKGIIGRSNVIRFFADLDWDALLQKKIPPPWKPTLNGDTDTSYFTHKYPSTELDDNTPPVSFIS